MAMTRLMTADELAQLPEDGYQYELMRGELLRMSPASGRHSARAINVARHFLNYADVRGGLVTGADGGYQLDLDPDTVLAPDVAFTRADRVPSEDELDRFVVVPSDVVVEIVSPSDCAGYLRKKLAAYLSAGVRLILYAYPRRRTVVVHQADGVAIELGEHDIFDGGDVMPGFRLPVSEFFR